MPPEKNDNDAIHFIALLLSGLIFIPIFAFNLSGFWYWPFFFIMIGVVAVLRGRSAKRQRADREKNTGIPEAPTEIEESGKMSLLLAPLVGLGAFAVGILILVAAVLAFFLLSILWANLSN